MKKRSLQFAKVLPAEEADGRHFDVLFAAKGGSELAHGEDGRFVFEAANEDECTR